MIISAPNIENIIVLKLFKLIFTGIEKIDSLKKLVTAHKSSVNQEFVIKSHVLKIDNSY